MSNAAQYVLLSSVDKFCEPVAYSSIFPYVNQQIEDLGTEPDKVGYYVGLIGTRKAFHNSMRLTLDQKACSLLRRLSSSYTGQDCPIG